MEESNETIRGVGLSHLSWFRGMDGMETTSEVQSSGITAAIERKIAV